MNGWVLDVFVGGTERRIDWTFARARGGAKGGHPIPLTAKRSATRSFPSRSVIASLSHFDPYADAALKVSKGRGNEQHEREGVNAAEVEQDGLGLAPQRADRRVHRDHGFSNRPPRSTWPSELLGRLGGRRGA